MTKRVCLVGPAYPYRGGIPHFTTLLAREFGKDTQVKVVNFTRLYPSIFFPGTTQYDDSDDPLKVDSERRIDSINPFTYYSAARAIARFQPDVVVFQWWHPFFAPAYAGIIFFLKRLCKCRIIFLCHNVLPHEASPLDRTLIRMGFAQVNDFLVQSDEDRRNLLAMKADANVAVNPHPIYDVFGRGEYTRDSARKELELEGQVMLFFGLIRPYKGLSILLDAFARYVGKAPATLLVVGEFYENPQPYYDQLQSLGIAEHVRFVDRYVPDEEVEKYFAAADVVVLPYRSATQSGIVQIAYGLDRPVIVTRVGGLPDVVDDGVSGFVVPPEDPEALADAMIRFFSGDNAARMTAAVGGIKERFSWRRCRDTLESLAESAELATNE